MSASESFRKFARALLQPINTSSAVILGAYTVLWGLWVASPFWTVFTQAALFSSLAATGVPEWAWGLLAITCGLITIYGAVKQRYGPLVRGAQASFWHWFMISIFYFVGDALNTGGITALTFAIYAAYLHLNIRVNFKHDKKSARMLR